MNIVEAQTHLWTLAKAPPHHRRTSFVITKALQAMDAAGVHYAVNHPAIWDPDANRYAIAASTRCPDRLATLGCFDLKRPPDIDFAARFFA